MTEREFHVRFRDIDAVVVTLMWGVFLRSSWDVREIILAALGQLESAVAVDQFRARRPPVPPPPVAVPDLQP